MSKIEKEVKVLNINVEKTKDLLIKMGAVYKGEKNQKIYVYDIPTLYYRFLEIRTLLDSSSPILMSTNLKKLENLLVEYIDLVDEKELKEIDFNILNNINNLSIAEIRELLKSKELEESFSKLNINPNKWIRLRESNGETELTVKHILEKKNDRFQNVIESEIKVSSLEEANTILESIGICKRSYQEKIRYSYEYKNAEIEIDIWPLLEPYLEIECDEDNIIDEIIEKTNLKDHEIVSLNTEKLYNRINIDIHNISELKF